MQMHDPATRLVVTQEAQNRRMVAAGYARKKLEAPSKQDCLGTVLILSGNK